MDIFARHALVDSRQGPALLLEGDWPAGEESPDRYSLDGSIDARHAWIDEAASALAEQVADPAVLSTAYINALALRYYLVKLLRPIAFFQQFASPVPRVRLHAARNRDEDYADLIQQLCEQRRSSFDVRWREMPASDARSDTANGPIRRLASWLSARRSRDLPSVRRVLLCGNPAVLDPVCHELHVRSCRVAWLYDRFAFRAALRDAHQLTCDAACAFEKLAEAPCDRLPCHGVDLTPSISRWLASISRSRGDHQARLVHHVQRHLVAWQPECLVLDEDATPLKRIAVWIARQAGIPSYVIQHGAPRVRFGFAPLAADKFLAWGESSAQQLVAWGVPRDRIVVAGSPRKNTLQRNEVRRPVRAEIVLFATTPPRDDRPDAVEYHLTTRTHDDCLRMAFLAVAQLPGARLTIKLHPRSNDPSRIKQLIGEFPGLQCRVVKRGSPDRWLRGCDVVLNCGSSAGIEAAYSGLPVIELLPAGSRDLTPAAEWGLLASARSTDEVSFYLARALSAQCKSSSDAFIGTGASAARSIALEVA